MKRASQYVVRNIQHHDVPALTPFLKKYFHFEETIFKNLFLNNRSKLSEKELAAIDEDMLNETNYIMALNAPGIVIEHKGSNEIVASVTLFPIKNVNVEQHHNVYQNFAAKSQLFKNYLDITSKMIEEARIFERFPEAKNALEIDTAAVNKKFRGQGLYTQLLESSVKYAHDNQFDLIYGLFTSRTSRRAPEELNFKSIADYDLGSYCNFNSQSMDKRQRYIAKVMVKDMHKM